MARDVNDRIAEYEGTVAPAFMSKSMLGRPEDHLKKLPLRMGRIIKIHAPGTPTCRNKKFFEYDVLVDDGSENNPSTRFTLSHCWMISQFGGAADHSSWTPRVLQERSLKHDFVDEKSYGHGSRVLVLCINGSGFGGIILGGVQHTLKKDGDSTALGHHLLWEFNGIRANVDKDGQLHVTYNGKTLETGLPDNVSADVVGTGVHMLQDGGLKVNTKDEEQFIFVDHASHILSLQAKNDFKVLSNGTMTLESKGASKWTIGSTLDVEALGEINVKSTAGLIKTSSLGVHHGLATDAMVKGTTYRAAESVSNAGIMAGMQTVAAGMAAVAAALATAGAAIQAATVLHKIPVVGPILGSIPLQAAGVAIAAASAGATTAAGGATAAATALTTFEGGAPAYLSLINRLD